MNSLNFSTLEKSYFANKRSVSTDELFELAKYKAEHLEDDLANITSDGRMDSKTAKKIDSIKGRVFFFIDEAYKAGRQSESDLGFYVDTIRTVLKLPVPTKFISKWMQVSGKGEVKNKKVKKGWIQIESGSFGVGDITIAPAVPDEKVSSDYYSDANLVKFVNEGQVIYVGMGGMEMSELSFV